MRNRKATSGVNLNFACERKIYLSKKSYDLENLRIFPGGCAYTLLNFRTFSNFPITVLHKTEYGTERIGGRAVELKSNMTL